MKVVYIISFCENNNKLLKSMLKYRSFDERGYYEQITN